MAQPLVDRDPVLTGQLLYVPTQDLRRPDQTDVTRPVPSTGSVPAPQGGAGF